MNWLQRLIKGLGRRSSNPPAPGSEPAAPAEMPSDELMERWKRAAIAKYLNDGEHVWRTAALLAFAEPVATDGDLLKVWDRIFWADDARRAIYALGRADERTAILRALGVEL